MRGRTSRPAPGSGLSVDGPLWLNEEASWEFSLNRVRAQALGEITNSLVLIRPAILRVVIGPKGGLFDDAAKRRVKARFVHGGIHYMLKVTDPIAEARFLAGPDRTVIMTGSVLCISLTEVFGGYAYKLVAAVIEPPKGS